MLNNISTVVCTKRIRLDEAKTESQTDSPLVKYFSQRTNVLVYDQKHYLDLDPIPKMKPTLADTFR